MIRKPRRKYYYWTYINEEISILKSKIENILEVEFIRDYENVWEWIVSKDENIKINYNFSREHNWETGEFNKPLRIVLSSKNKLNQIELNKIISKIQSVIKSHFYSGEILNSGRNQSDYKIKEIIKYVT